MTGLFELLAEHLGHKVVLTVIGQIAKPDAISIECVDCEEVVTTLRPEVSGDRNDRNDRNE